MLAVSTSMVIVMMLNCRDCSLSASVEGGQISCFMTIWPPSVSGECTRCQTFVSLYCRDCSLSAFVDVGEFLL